MLQCCERSDVPLTTDAPQQTASLFDHLVGAGNDLRWHCEIECLGGLEVDYQFDFVGLLDRQVAGLFALENPAGINAHNTICVNNTGSVTYQAAGCGELRILIDRRYRMANSERRQSIGLARKECIVADQNCASPLLNQCCKGHGDIFFSASSQYKELYSLSGGRRL